MQLEVKKCSNRGLVISLISVVVILLGFKFVLSHLFFFGISDNDI